MTSTLFSTRLACLALSASALFLGGMLAQNLLAPTPVQAATVVSNPGATLATAKIQRDEDALFVLTGDTLSVYRTNVGNKKMELLVSSKLSAGKDDAPAGGGRAR